ncbi:rhodanese-like domain-containing protein, partial [Acinetobacter baumannii]
IPGARNIRLDTIDAKERDPALDRYKTIIVYGQTPGPTIERSTAKRLIQAKYDDVRWFEDGFKAWEVSGLPVARPEPGATPENPAPRPAA